MVKKTKNKLKNKSNNVLLFIIIGIIIVVGILVWGFMTNWWEDSNKKLKEGNKY